MFLVMGWKDIVSFIALAGGDESQLSSLDMEAGETITTPSEFNVVTVRAWDVFGIRNAEGDSQAWSAQVPEDHTLK